MIEKIEDIYDGYFEKLDLIFAKRKSTDGLFGFNKNSDAERCHDDFYAELKSALDNFGQDKDYSAVLRYMYEAPTAHVGNKETYWMLIAVHSLTEELIPKLSGVEAAELYKLYTSLYPPRMCLPIQKKLIKALKKCADLP